METQDLKRNLEEYNIHIMSKKQSDKTGGYSYLAMPKDSNENTPFAFDCDTDGEGKSCIHTQDLSYAEALHL